MYESWTSIDTSSDCPVPNQHTPGPWEVKSQYGHVNNTLPAGRPIETQCHFIPRVSIMMMQYYNVGSPEWFEAQANANLIIQAVNNHHALIDALEELYSDWLTCGANGIRDDKQVLLSKVHSVLLKAKGEQA